jgi:hypothetical protein
LGQFLIEEHPLFFFCIEYAIPGLGRVEPWLFCNGQGRFLKGGW